MGEIIVALISLCWIFYSLYIKKTDNERITKLEEKILALIDKDTFKTYQNHQLDFVKEKSKLMEAEAKVYKAQNPYQEMSNV